MGLISLSFPQVPHRRAAHSAVLLGVLAMVPLITACSKKAPPAASPPQVGVVTLHTQPILRTTTLPGRTESVMVSDVRPQVGGVILQRLFTEGGDVKEGQQLYQIDPSIYQADYDSALATLAHDQAALATANAKAERYRPLAAAQAVSAQDYSDAAAAAQEAAADVASANAAVEQARINLRYTKVLSPISGTIGASTVTPGALVTAEQATALATVTELDPIYVDVNEPTTVWLRLKQEIAAGQLESQRDGSAAVTLTLEDGSTYSLPGKLQFSEVQVDQSTGTVLVRALFPNPDHLLLPGMYVHAELQEGMNPNGILVPQQAVSRNTRGDATVYVVGKDNKAELKVIQIGDNVGDQWVVTGGLQAGERVIVDGLQSVEPDAPVTPVEESAAFSSNSKS
jgi:membrane fusion protein (multidrug efflux system)